MIRTALAVTALMILPGFLVAQEQQAAAEERGAHQVVEGNTLWELAGRFYDDPWQWPVIWEANRDRIDDPHWIYPGQQLRIPDLETGEVTEVIVVAPGEGGDEGAAGEAVGDTMAEVDTEQVARDMGGDRFGPKPIAYRTSMYPRALEDAVGAMAARTPVPLVSRDQSYSAAWLDLPGEDTRSLGRLLALSGAQGDRSPRQTMRTFDRVRLVFDGPIPPVGSHLQVFREDHDIEAGTVVIPTGVVTILDVDPAGAEGMVFREYDRMALGDRVRLLPDFPYPPGGGVVTEPVLGGREVSIIGFGQERAVHSLYDVAFLDAGAADDIRIGDEFAVVWTAGSGWSGEIEARVRVVAVDPTTSSARIVNIDEPIFTEGLRLRLKSRIR